MNNNFVKVRVAVTVDINGDWSCAGGSLMDDGSDSLDSLFWAGGLEEPQRRFFLTAELPLPEDYEAESVSAATEEASP